MKIGFDAKRAFLNKSGLGNYSRNILNGLSKYFPNDSFQLYTPKTNDLKLYQKQENQEISLPSGLINSNFKSFWRSKGILKDLKTDKIDLYHGLSNELPFGIEKTGIKSVVTIHDLIFMRYPEFYPKIDRFIYEKKFKSACKRANQIIAISQQTKEDLIHFLSVPEQKIKVVYQNCHPQFYEKQSEEKINSILDKHKIPNEFMLYVGTIEARKNVLTAIKAWHVSKTEIPFLIVGKSTPYINEIKFYLDKYHLNEKVLFRHGIENHELPGLFQQALLFIYPSIFEGFGIPILEAMTSGTPVITSKGSCFEETGGEAAFYVNPTDVGEMKEAILSLISDSTLRENAIKKGFLQAEKFKEEKIATDLMNVYSNLLTLHS
ncbi:MAG: glycosyltransferase family 1 protein [Bacteroidota bacterium]